MGSLERFMAVLIEHYAGAFPVWLSPVQIAVLPVTTSHNAKAKKLAKLFEQENIRVLFDDAKESVGKKIRNAQMQKIPYMIVFGDKEAKSKIYSLKNAAKKKSPKPPKKHSLKNQKTD